MRTRASSSSASLTLDNARYAATQYLTKQAMRCCGLIMFVACGFILISLATWNIADPSLNHATSNPVTNFLGLPGAITADLFTQFFGLAATLTIIPAASFALRFLRGEAIDDLRARFFMWALFSVFAAGAIGAIAPPASWPLPTGLGGVFGDLVLKPVKLFTGAYPSGFSSILFTVLYAGLALFFLHKTLRSSLPDDIQNSKTNKMSENSEDHDASAYDADDNNTPMLQRLLDFSAASAAFGFVMHHWLSLKARARRTIGLPAMGSAVRNRAPTNTLDDDFDFGDGVDFDQPRSNQNNPSLNSPRLEPSEQDFIDNDDETSENWNENEAWQNQSAYQSDYSVDLGNHGHASFGSTQTGNVNLGRSSHQSARGRTPIEPQFDGPETVSHSPAAANLKVDAPATSPKPGKRITTEAQGSLLASDAFQLPPLHLLSENKNTIRDPSLSKDVLEENARMLEGVLDDFGVKGEIIHVRPGPVVTMYEFEPAPGIKSARVIGLSDDIARSMSAIAARVAVVPGRNAIGIELPNDSRETVYLRELLASRDYEQTKTKLGLTLGKTINGEAVIADLAKMPHVLVAGTTGSGKSVAINAMILSLLYRLSPEQCRLIMIDPKMLELSVYDGIPHLLTPVVTDPKKAVVALKWTVREMEDRYRKMAKLGVRNIDGFNQRVAESTASGESLNRTVQTGFDRESGQAIYETEALELSKLPYIVVIIDEMADLMMVAGKEIEGLVQRLAQMARAAGIHVIMATQRPSVDVITGTIKANFPTRISFQVTSKIDSRTILGEQGAEQLLGMGDMLYMASGGRTQRVHGPFVSDQEVEDVVRHLKTQGVPDYLDAVTEDDEDEESDGSTGGSGSSGAGNYEESDDPYDQAVAVVLRDRKASTSYIQRRLGIGYNRAASIIERMEEEGLIGAANHAGKREILVPEEGDTI